MVKAPAADAVEGLARHRPRPKALTRAPEGALDRYPPTQWVGRWEQDSACGSGPVEGPDRSRSECSRTGVDNSNPRAQQDQWLDGHRIGDLDSLVESVHLSRVAITSA
jgi:hypothetical protein